MEDKFAREISALRKAHNLGWDSATARWVKEKSSVEIAAMLDHLRYKQLDGWRTALLMGEAANRLRSDK